MFRNPQQGGWVTGESTINAALQEMTAAHFGPLDLLPYAELPEKLLALALTGPPAGPAGVAAGLHDLAAALNSVETSTVRVVVFGGGTGLSNVIGGDSRDPEWPRAPFFGLKTLFPQTRAVVCVTDDGGSTGELLKELPLIAIGDLRHVLLSTVQKAKLQKQYDLTDLEATRVAAGLHALFNHRFSGQVATVADLLAGCAVCLDELPEFMGRSLYWLLHAVCTNPLLQGQLAHPHCLGNLLVVAAIYQQGGAAATAEVPATAIVRGLEFLADLLGADPDAVLPSTTTPAQLKLLYDNGVLVTGEHKSSEARRHCAVDRVLVEFADEPGVPAEVLAAIAAADIILFAPGSLFTSVVPILQVPGIAEAIRANRTALKVLISNLWVQAGETDLIVGNPERRFHVSDLLLAYQRNIPGGIAGLFEEIMVMGLEEIPGSILQSYALENKMPIYLDRERVRALGFTPIEAPIYSQHDIDRRRVVQHDPASVARAIRALWGIRTLLRQDGPKAGLPAAPAPLTLLNPRRHTPNQRLATMATRLEGLAMPATLRQPILEILWHHGDIPPEHLDYLAGLTLVPFDEWGRCQEWDNVFSFYDPEDQLIKIRADAAAKVEHLEPAFLVALGQSLLGDYAVAKEKSPVQLDGEAVGSIFQLTLRKPEARHCFFSPAELTTYLTLARMRQSEANPLLFTRVVNGSEGFTPPGLLFGLTYAWYLDNRFAPNMEYKMSIVAAETSDLVPEQIRIARRRQTLIDFFRTVVFRYDWLP